MRDALVGADGQSDMMLEQSIAVLPGSTANHTPP